MCFGRILCKGIFCQDWTIKMFYAQKMVKMADAKADAPLVPSSSRNLPDFKKSVRLKYVKLGYHYLISHGMYLFLSPLVVLISAQLSTFSLQDLHDLWQHLQYNLISVILCSTLLVFLSTLYFLTRPRPVYLVNFACYKPEESRKCTKRVFMEHSRLAGTFTEEILPSSRRSLRDLAWERTLTFRKLFSTFLPILR
ncbi:3-ketoacyl-CoA synthase [Arachis hypogaea]|nr:3-ketoacyl-CoA synthase [Arachis hypogaea]